MTKLVLCCEGDKPTYKKSKEFLARRDNEKVNKIKEEDADEIRIWYCENCGHYALDFFKVKLYCVECGYHMKNRKYI